MRALGAPSFPHNPASVRMPACRSASFHDANGAWIFLYFHPVDPMLLLILGADERTISVIQSLRRRAESVRVVGWFESDLVGDQLAQDCPEGNRIGSAEAFVETVTTETTVVVGPSSTVDDREQLLRELARDGIPLILQQPVCSGILAVELDMIQRDTDAPMVPYHPPSHHAVIARLAQWTRSEDSPVGRIEQVVMERAMLDRSDRAVHAELARDAMLLRRLIGKFEQVGAMSAKASEGLANLSVQLTGESQAVCRWSVVPATARLGATMTLVGERGRISLSMPEDAGWVLGASDEQIPTETLSPLDEDALAKDLLAALHGQPVGPTWEDAFRATDLADLACESHRRGKTLPVSNTRLTEEDTFKGMMAAGGCLIILVIPLLLLLVSLFDGLELPRDRTTVIRVTQGQREITLPGDVVAIDTVKLFGDSADLPVMSRRRLFERYGQATEGKPAAYALGRNSITIAPAADGEYQFEFSYEGSFRIWRGWPLLLLSPIAVFLLLQLLKLAFPKKRAM